MYKTPALNPSQLELFTDSIHNNLILMLGQKYSAKFNTNTFDHSNVFTFLKSLLIFMELCKKKCNRLH